MFVKKVLLTIIGFVLLGIGAIGIFIPIWPTTPFVLLAVACFSVNPKLKAKLMKVDFIRDHSVNYKERTGLTKRTVIISLAFLWVSMGISMIVTHTGWLTLLLATIGIAVTIHILCMARPKRSNT